ncbi:MAG: aspartate/glutamate racemase family protein [Candidatus Bathyarchaeota archaeon]|nr:MAG: aspartate/glutamate racemase family protein [Candidatus Bathyarchaeota archaeon]
MYGWRAKLGILVPSVNTVMEPELNRLAPDGVSIHAARLKLVGEFTPKNLIQMTKETQHAAEELKGVVDVIAYGCTSGSFVKGMNWDTEIIAQITKATNLPATTTSTAVVKALKKTNLKKISMATPYPDEVNQLEKEFLENHGFEVIAMKGLNFRESSALARARARNRFSASIAYKLAKEVNTGKSDGIFISCTHFKTIEVLEKLEQDLEKPVISSNQATMWEMLRMVAVREPIKGYGSLLLEY